MQIANIDTQKILRKVRKLGIEFPKGKPDWWWDDLDFVGDPYSVSWYLTDNGKAGVLKLIRDERRANIEWWAKIVGSVITLLTGLAGTIIGILAVWRK